MIKGYILLLLSAITFSLSTVFAKIVTTTSNIEAVELTFFRFITGFITVSVYVAITRKSLVPKNKKYISLRAFFNTIAVIFFFLGIQYTTITKANLLNMTYPIFVFLLAPFINREKSSSIHFLYLFLTMVGLYLVIVPDVSIFKIDQINIGDIYSLISGIVAGFAIATLREARKYDASYMILFYLMALGSIINCIIVIPFFIIPTGTVLILVILTTITSLLGQVFITVGYKYINASAGSLVSSSRILFAIILGITIFSDHISIKMGIGGILILISLIGVSGIIEKKFKNND